MITLQITNVIKFYNNPNNYFYYENYVLDDYLKDLGSTNESFLQREVSEY